MISFAKREENIIHALLKESPADWEGRDRQPAASSIILVATRYRVMLRRGMRSAWSGVVCRGEYLQG